MKNQKCTLATELNFKLILILFILAALFITALTLLYPFALISKKIEAPNLSFNFEEEMKISENNFHPTPGTEKMISWLDPAKNKTARSLVYLHGWSATRQEIYPVVETVAQHMKANFFMTRLKGHGLGTEGMSTVTTDALLADAEEAFQVGKKIGEKVILIGMSTGASLAVYLANKYSDQIEAMILISPNFRPYRTEALLTRGPFGPIFSRVFVGPYYEFIPKNKEQEKYWTTRYPSRALTEMMNLVDGVRRINLSKIQIPTLFLYTEKDETINVAFVKEKFLELGSEKKKLIAIDSPNHILAGTIMTPESTDHVIQEIEKFLN